MNQRHRASSSSLFLMELILAILFFCIASTICISIFARSHSMNVDARNLNNAVSEASNIAEIISSSNSMSEIDKLLSDEYEGIKNNGDKYLVILDKEFNPTLSEAYFGMEINFKENDELLDSHISIYELESETVIYELDVTHFISERKVPNAQ